MTRLWCVVVFWVGSAAAQTVEGTVLDSVTGNGIGGVKAVIVQTGKPGAAGRTTYSATTDGHGQFSVEDVKDGTYIALYSSPGYSPSDYAVSQHGQVALGGMPVFQVTVGRNPVKLVVHMMPFARITGRIVDNSGKAVPNAKVELSGSNPPPVTTADVNGKFEFHEHLLAGTYTLSVVPPLDLKPPDPEAGSDRALHWTRTWYPGVGVPDAAAQIVLQPGEEASNIEIKLVAVPTHALRGVLLYPDGSQAPKVAITLEESLHRQPTLHAESQPDGTFEFPVVINGEWRILTELQSRGVKLRGERRIEMTGHDIENLELRLSPPFVVRGKVVIESPHGIPAPDPSSLKLGPYLASTRNGPATPPAKFVADGSFVLEDVYPGTYSVVPAWPPWPYYLDSLKVGDVDVTTPEVEFFGAISIAVLYKSNGGTLHGTVEKCAGGLVALIPLDQSQRLPGFLRGVLCDAQDRYEVALRPGDYYIVAFARELAPLAATTLNRFIDQASKVTIRAGEITSADLHLAGRTH